MLQMRLSGISRGVAPLLDCSLNQLFVVFQETAAAFAPATTGIRRCRGSYIMNPSSGGSWSPSPAPRSPGRPRLFQQPSEWSSEQKKKGRGCSRCLLSEGDVSLAVGGFFSWCSCPLRGSRWCSGYTARLPHRTYCRFSEISGSPPPPSARSHVHAFNRCSILTSFHPHQFSRPLMLRAGQISALYPVAISDALPPSNHARRLRGVVWWCSGQITHIPPKGIGFDSRRDVTPGFSHVGIASDDAVGRRVFSGMSRLPCPFIPALLQSPTSALKTSTLRAAQISPLTSTAPGGWGDQLEAEKLVESTTPALFVLKDVLVQQRLLKYMQAGAVNTHESSALSLWCNFLHLSRVCMRWSNILEAGFWQGIRKVANSLDHDFASYLRPGGRAGFYCVSGLTPYSYKEGKSYKETCIASKRDWAAMACSLGP
ncbi:hypothetical protein PR048_032345 [Dryococelus australis]|uniref:Uncharacterized protein n=1 Tax=Dryococelus australis TaxID=614101 RepID=A0ABQ9G4Z5_9NEOP|nr:hypothetical protein PR048_032345 [Dryococelus australis]